MPSTFFGWVAYLWKEYWPLLLKGAWNSIYISLLGTVIGFCMGLITAILRTIPDSENRVKNILLKILRFICVAYIEVFRGTPLMVQAMVIYYGLIQYAHIQLPLLAASMIIVGLNTGAYMAEIMRSGITSVNRGQTEAALSVGMTHWQAMRYIILPQAIRNVMPSIGNEFVVNVKDTSVLNVIAVSELYFVAKSASGTYLRYFEVYSIVAVMYLVITFILSKLLHMAEKKMDGPENFELEKNEETRHV